MPLLATLVELKAQIDLDTTDGDHDALCTALLNAAESELARRTGRFYGTPASKIEVLSGRGSSVLYTANPIRSLTSVEIRQSEGLGASWGTVSTSEYEVVGTNGVLRKVVSWPEGSRNVRITYSAGLLGDGTETPAATKQLVLDMASWMYQNRKQVVTEAGVDAARLPPWITQRIAFERMQKVRV
jgi:uncharacterized phiE125 gp8 family phage protein